MKGRLQGTKKLLKSASKPEQFHKLVNSKAAWELVCAKESGIRKSGDDAAHPLISSPQELSRVHTAATEELDGEEQKGILVMIEYLSDGN